MLFVNVKFLFPPRFLRGPMTLIEPQKWMVCAYLGSKYLQGECLQYFKVQIEVKGPSVRSALLYVHKHSPHRQRLEGRVSGLNT